MLKNRFLLNSILLVLAIAYLKRTPGMLPAVGIIAILWGAALLVRHFHARKDRK